MIPEQRIREGLGALGLDGSSAVIVHSSLSSFGRVEGRALTVCRALMATCGTVLMPAFTWGATNVCPPPGPSRPLNAAEPAPSWEAFDETLAQAAPFSEDLAIDKGIGLIPETMRRELSCLRSKHPKVSFIAAGRHAEKLVGAQRLDHPLGPIEALAELDGDVLLLGVGHSRNTTIHLAEQRLGRSRFYRYAKIAPGAWVELPNLPGCSEGFDAIESHLAGATQEAVIGECHAHRIPVADVLEVAERLIVADPGALLCDREGCGRCEAALRQRLAWMERQP